MRTRLRAMLVVGLVAATVTAQSPPPPLPLPPRGAGARSGAQILPYLTNRSVDEREAFLWHEFASGNVPEFLRSFVPVEVTRADASGRRRRVRFEVLPDYLAVGRDGDFFRMPMSPILGQRLADRLGCALPTRRMVDDIWAAAPIRLSPVTFHPQQYTITSPALFLQHHVRIEQQRAGRPLGPIVAGTKKDVVVSPRLGTTTRRVVIYGWHRPNGAPIQPLYSGHGERYVDYSHGVRLVRRSVTVDGRPTTIAAVLADPVLHPLLSDEGPFTTSRYASGTPDETVPFVDAFTPAGFALSSWRTKFTPAAVVPFLPRAPRGGDGRVVVVRDPAGGTDSIRCGTPTTTDQIAQADVYCEYRPGLSSDGFERVGIFVRDRAAGAFDGTLSQNGACYALAWDSHDGRLWCLRAHAGVLTDLLPAPVYLPSTAWRRLRAEARGSRLRFFVDGALVLDTIDTTHPVGEFGIGYHEFFRTNANMRGTRAEHWFADVPDALRLEFRTEANGATTIATTRGVPGDLYVRPLTLSPGAFPNGWFYGLDIPVPDLATQIGSAHAVFVGSFDAAGAAETTLPLPAGLTLHGVALDLFSSLPPVATSAPAAWTVR